VTERHVAVAKLVISGILALVLIIAMTWIVLSPTTEEVAKAALIIIGTAVGFVFGRETTR
jgi:hypothetical protein